MTTRSVLLVEDDASDVMLMQEALAMSRAAIELSVAVDGAEALAFLRGQGAFGAALKPGLVLLDWRLPKLSGEEVLAAIRADEALGTLPVIVLTTSASDRDVRAAYALGANCFLTKPKDLGQLRSLVAALENFWFVHARLPPRAEIHL